MTGIYGDDIAVSRYPISTIPREHVEDVAHLGRLEGRLARGGRHPVTLETTRLALVFYGARFDRSAVRGPGIVRGRAPDRG
jgi:hypothetical protein